ncbi:MAG: septum site-determining protein MinC [Methylovulum sp.]|nr:septum site-determining protein MinC [Methylovulum sp.]
MSTDSQNTPHTASVLEFKSSTFSVPVLVLSNNDLKAIEQQLQQKIQLAPEFFKNSPIVFDLQELNKQEVEIDITSLANVIRKSGLVPIGIRGGNEEQIQTALALQIPVYSIHNSLSSDTPKQKKNVPLTASEQKIENSTTLITQPIRSGQRIYAAGDLIVMAQVSAGAEIMAEGNIHIYNTLRGRALAGVQGNPDARIFCFDLQAELISIAGNYKISEDINDSTRNRPVQIYLQEHTLFIKDIREH